MAYRMLARNQPLPNELTLAIQGKKFDAVPAANVPRFGEPPGSKLKPRVFFLYYAIFNII